MLSAGSEATVSTSYQGDGITVQARIEVVTDRPTQLEFIAPTDHYQLRSAKATGSSRPADQTTFEIRPGRSVITATYHHRALNFTADQWESVELIRDGVTRVTVVSEPQDPYSRGTAGMLNDFLGWYDLEDGIAGNLAQAAVVRHYPADVQGWRVILQRQAGAAPGSIRISPANRNIYLLGADAGEIRRAMVHLLRLLDRKYPHVGRFGVADNTPGVRVGRQGDTVTAKWTKDPPTRAFFEAFVDPDFLSKPILSRSCEPLYADGNADFQGAYTLRFSPHLLEPTAGEDFVYDRPED
jgi:hypothetical protein